MSRVPYPDPANLSDKARERLEQGAPLNLLRMMCQAETAFIGYSRMGRPLLRRGLLNPHLRELAILRVGYLTSSVYEQFQHVALARAMGMAEDKIEGTAIGSASPVFSEQEAGLLRFVEETFNDLRVSDPTFAEAQRHFSSAELMELSIVTGFYVMTAGFLMTFDIEPESNPALSDSMRDLWPPAQ